MGYIPGNILSEIEAVVLAFGKEVAEEVHARRDESAKSLAEQVDFFAAVARRLLKHDEPAASAPAAKGVKA
jgi:hypothetical protein